MASFQHPVPNQIDERKAFDTIAIDKDVDGVTSLGFGQLSMGFGKFPSCTPAGIISYFRLLPIADRRKTCRRDW